MSTIEKVNGPLAVIELVIYSSVMTENPSDNAGLDTRKPSPPFGYSTVCTHTLEEQIHIVAEFHVHRIPPNRIAYRIGIDLALIEDLLAGRQHKELFTALVAKYRKDRRAKRLQQSKKLKGIGQAELQESIEKEYLQSVVSGKT